MSEWSRSSRAGKAGTVTFWVLFAIFAPIMFPIWLCLKFVRL
jgi:hypothetical protein